MSRAIHLELGGMYVGQDAEKVTPVTEGERLHPDFMFSVDDAKLSLAAVRPEARAPIVHRARRRLTEIALSGVYEEPHTALYFLTAITRAHPNFVYHEAEPLADHAAQLLFTDPGLADRYLRAAGM